MKYSVLPIFLLLISYSLLAQKNRYDFATSYFGVEGEFINEKNDFKFINNNGIEQIEKLPSTFTPRILIGATHFWNRADFYISIPLINFALNGQDNAKINNGVLTGLRAYPIALEKNKVRPFIGIGFSGKDYRQEGVNGKSQHYTNWQCFYEGGLSYQTSRKKLISLTARHLPQNDYTVFYSNTNAVETSLSPFSISVSYKKLIDLTSGYKSENAKKYLSKLRKAYEKGKALNTFSVGLGLSALIPMKKTELASRNEFINDEVQGNLSLDIGLAYYHHNLDAAARISYRPFKQEEISYEYSYQSIKHSIAVEAFKFIGDYHGFVPFIGPYISADKYAIEEKMNGDKQIDFSATKIGYGLVFGWDIRLSDVDYLLLRTNLRYTPNLGYKIENKSYTPNQLEFNFIQLVLYPERIKLNKTLKNEL